MKARYRPGIEASREARSAIALAHLESMRADYLVVVGRRLADPKIPEKRKLSIYGIAKELTELGHHAPKNPKTKVPYRVAKRLVELVGDVQLKAQPVRKKVTELQVGDRVSVISPDRIFHGQNAEVREIMDDGDAFRIAIDYPGNGPAIREVLSHELQHLPR
jgi:hypothetical protein